jgi:hypothetical protein
MGTHADHTDRALHLTWCKERAKEYIRNGDLDEAMSSMISDLKKHPDTEHHGAIALMVQMKMAGALSTAEEMERFIEGFN